MIKTKKAPIRTCISCRESSEKKELIRIVRTNDGIKIDPSGKLAGRGAYVCKSKDCFDFVLKKDRLCKVLKTIISSSDIKELEGYYKKTFN